jgi:hypothetical protein
MRPWSQAFRCVTCDGHFSDIIDKADKEKPAPCIYCDGMADPVFSVPMILKATYPDGTRRPGFREGAEASRLEAESFNLPPDKRSDYDREIKELRASTSKRKESK